VKLITFDFSDAHVEALEKGTIDIMIIQEPFRLGYDSVKALVEKLRGAEPAKRIDLPARLIVKSDLGNPEVRKMLFPDWLKKR
jgi:ribose transport system substrate-binding protein